MNKYDAVVIGSGTGGLSAALTLATAGKKTLLIERHNMPGGCATGFVRGRFEFDASLHEYCGIGEPGNWGPPGKLMMEDYKLNITWLPAPELYHCYGTTRSGRKLDFVMPVGKENVLDAMEKVVPNSRRPMETFFALCEECSQAYDYFNEHMDQFTKDDFIKTDDMYFIKHFPNFLKVAERPFNTVLRSIGMPEDAIDLLNIYWAYIGTDYETISFIHQAWMIYTYITKKPATCKYKSHGMTTIGIERFRELGGEVWCNVTATKVCSDNNGKIIGVETTAGYVETNYVIANLNPQFAYTKLLDKKVKLPERELKRVNASKHGVAIFNVYLGLNKSIEELGIKDYAFFVPGTFDTRKNIEEASHFETNPYGGAVVYNVADPKASPAGTTIMTFTVCYVEDVWGDFSQREYVKKKQEAFGMVLDNFENATGIKIRDSIEEIEMASPWTFVHYLNTPHGTVYGYEISRWDTMISRLLALKKDQPVRGFKTVGASGARGDGYSQTYLNGNDIAKLLLQEMAEEGK